MRVKTSSIPREELEAAWERVCKDYQKETQENAGLKKTIKHLRSELERKENLIIGLRRNLIRISPDKKIK